MNDFSEIFGYWIMAAVLVLLGLLGIVVAAKAVDNVMLVFGLSLALFAIFYCFFAIDRAHRQPEA